MPNFYRTPLGKVFLALTVLFLLCSIWMYLMYRAFSYDGKRQMSKQIINGVSSYVSIPAGGTFAIHDIMSKSKYGDMESFVKKLKDMGYEDVRLVSTTNNDPITPFEAFWMGLSGSAVLYGRK